MTTRTKRDRIMAGIWDAVRNMIEPELERYRARYPRSRRCQILKALHAAAVAQDEYALTSAGRDYFKLTGVVPPGCYAVCAARQPSHYLTGQRVAGRKRGEEWHICRHSPQVYR